MKVFPIEIHGCSLAACRADHNPEQEKEFPLNVKWNKWQCNANPMNLKLKVIYIYIYILPLLFRLPPKRHLIGWSQSASSPVENINVL
jgi:hypothetical protein